MSLTDHKCTGPADDKCRQCIHQIQPVRPNLFGAGDLRVPAIMKLYGEWHARERERYVREDMAVGEGHEFSKDNPPLFEPWCEVLSKSSGYALWRRLNYGKGCDGEGKFNSDKASV